MKTKTIEKVISSKINEWLLTIDDAELRERIAKDVIVTGGCITSMFLDEDINDYDVYFSSNKSVFEITKYYIEKMIDLKSYKILPMIEVFTGGESKIYRVKGEFEGENMSSCNEQYKLLSDVSIDFENIERVSVHVKSQGFAAEGTENDYKYFENTTEEVTNAFFEDIAETKEADKYRPVFMSSNAISLSGGVQLVIRFSGDAKKIHESFDFIHATNWWTESDGLNTNVAALESILSKDLKYSGSLYPLASIFRTRKFIQRGWTCHVGNYLKMAMQLNDLDLCDIEVLKDQLTGVDAAYLNQVIAILKQKSENCKNFTFNGTYLCEIIDRTMG